MDKFKPALLYIRRHAPVFAVLFLAAKTVLTAAGLTDVAEAVGLAGQYLSLGVVDPDTAAATVAGAGAIYKVYRNLSAKPAPAGGAA